MLNQHMVKQTNVHGIPKVSDVLTTELGTFTVSGAVAVAAGTSRKRVPPGKFLILGAIATVDTAPTGSVLTVDVLLNGTTIYTGGTNRPSIAAGGHTSADPIVAPAVTATAWGDYLQVSVAAVGSTTPGSNLVVTVYGYRIP